MYITGRALFFLALVVSVITAEDIKACKLLSETDTQGTQADWTGYRVVADLAECEAQCLMNDTCFAAEFRRDTMYCYSYSNDTAKTLEKGVTFLTKVCLGSDPPSGNRTDVANATSDMLQPSGTVASASYIADMLDPSATDMQDFASLASAFPNPPNIDHLESMANATFGKDWANNSSMSNDSLPSVEVAASMNITDGSDSIKGLDVLANATHVTDMNGSVSMNDSTDSMDVNGTVVDNANGTNVASLGISPSGTVPGHSSDETQGVTGSIMPSHTAGVSIELPTATSSSQGDVTPGIDSVGHTVVTGPSAGASMSSKVQASSSSSVDATTSVTFTLKPVDVTKPLVKDDTTAPQTQNIVIVDTTSLPPKTTIPPTTTTTTTKPAARQPTDSATITSVPLVTTPPVPQPYGPQNPYNPYQTYNRYNPYGNPQGGPRVPPQPGNQPPQVPPYPQPNPQYPPYPNPQYPQYPPYQPNPQYPQYPQYPPYPYGPRYPQYPQYPPYQIPPQGRPQPQIPVYQIPKGTDPPIRIEEKRNRLCFNRDKFPDLKLPEEKPKLFLIPSGDTGKFSVVAVPTRHNPVICFPVSYRGKVPILHLPAQNTQAQYNQYNQQQQFPYQFPGQGGPQFPFQNGNQNQFLPGATVPVPIDIKDFLEKYEDIYSETTAPKTTIAGGAQTTSSTPDDKVLGSNDTVDTNNTDSQSANITGGDVNITFSGNQGSVNESIRNITLDLNTNQIIPERILNITDPLTEVRLPSNNTYTASSVMHLRRNNNSSIIKTVSDTSVDNSFVSTNTSSIRLDVLNEMDEVTPIDINADISKDDTHSTKSNANLASNVSKTIQPTIKGKVILSRTEAVQPITAVTVTESNHPTSPPRRVRPPRYGRHRPNRKKPNRNRPKKTPKSKPKRRRRPRPTPDPMAKYKGKHPMRYARPRYWRRRKNPRPIRHPSSVGRKYRSRLLRSRKSRERALRNSYS
ncbi:proteoglycan 4-like isoform X3 [Haliotis rufescens]|uniref:proteoglycan 4-like isoform X2 n=1 Tax=Haliotis rufescens TaxID=6454 RepID=UPI00201EE638|nr:proteoglycan 4-like isoform X2 [Haliotis rufescens]XP_048248614.1 proteoglycan 4-like isoform X3 [Haliotis rufescens]